MRMELRLVAGHPDRLGGLRFVLVPLRGFTTLAFAIGRIPGLKFGTLDAKELKSIFKKFYRTQRAEQSGEAGTGMGAVPGLRSTCGP